MHWTVKLVARIIWIYAFITLALILALSAFPAVMMNVALWDFDRLVGLDAMPEALLWFIRLFFIGLGYPVFGLTMMAVLPALRILMRWNSGEGSHPVYSFSVWKWYNYNGAILIFQTLFGKFARTQVLYPMFLRGMGAKIGRNVLITSNVVYDHDMLEIGDNTIIGGDAAIIGHVGERGRLVRHKIRIGRDCTIGQYTTVFPGVTMGDNCHVGAMSLVPKGATLDANAVYGGVPVRKLKDLEPGSGGEGVSDMLAFDQELERADDEGAAAA